MLGTTASRDAGKSSVPQAAAFSGLPFKEQQLKQLRAQCIVLLAFRNGLMPKKLHLAIALGNMFTKQGGGADGPCKDLIDHHVGKAQCSDDPNTIPGGAMQFGRLSNARETDRIPPGASSSGKILEVDSLSREVENLKIMEDKSDPSPDQSIFAEDRKPLPATEKAEAEIKGQETTESQAFLTNVPQ